MIKRAEVMDVAAAENENLENFQRIDVAGELSRDAAVQKDSNVYSSFGLLGKRSSPWEKDVIGIELEREKIRLLRKIEEAEAEVEEMKKRRAEDARANEKVAAMFATQRQHWKMEKKKLKQQLEILLKQRQALEEFPSEQKLDCSRCEKKKNGLMLDLEAKSLQMEDELVRAFNGLEICKKDCKIMFEEKKEITERLSSEIVRLRRDTDEKEEVISSLLRKSDEKEELERNLTLVEAKRNQGDWPGLEKSLHAVHIKQRHLLEMDAFERQMRAKDERMEVFRQKLLSMDNKLQNLQAENTDLVRSLELAKAKNANLEILLKEKDFVPRSLKENIIFHEKSKMHSQSEQILHELEDAKCKIEKVEHKATKFRAVDNSKAKDEEFREFTFPAVKAKLIQTQTDYEEGKERLSFLLKSSKSVPIKYSRDRNFLRERLESTGEDCERVLPMENPHLICLIQQATQAFGPSHQETGLEGMLQTTKEKAGNSGVHSLLTRVYKKEQDGYPREELPTIVDKHVSGTCKCGNAVDSNQTEDVVVAPVKLQSEQAIWGEWQKGRATASVDSESQVSLPGRNGQLKGKSVFQDQYTTDKRVGRVLDDVHHGGEAEKQTTELSTTHAQTIPVKSFPARKNDDLSCDASSYLKHILEGRYSSTKKDTEALAISTEVKRLEQQLLQLEKMSKVELSKRIHSKDGTLITDLNTENGNDYDQVKSESKYLSAIQLLKKQFKRYQALIGKMDDLCTRIHEKDPAHTNTGNRSREQIAVQELFLIETFQLQHYLAATGQKLIAIQSDIAHKSCAMNNEIAFPTNLNMMQSVESVKSHLKEIQRSLEIRLARIIGDLEGTLARDGILHVMPAEWKEDHNTKFGKIKQEISS